MRVHHSGCCLVQLIKRIVQRFGKPRARFRQFKRSRQSLEQLNAEKIFKCLDLTADRALRDIEFRGGDARSALSGGRRLGRFGRLSIDTLQNYSAWADVAQLYTEP
jgi:hypothetical protein